MTLEIDYEAMVLHAGHVGTSASDVSLAAQAAATVSDDAFGVLCSFIPPILNSFWPTNLSAIQDASSDLSDIEATLKKVVADLQAEDGGVKKAADDLRSALP